MKKKHCITLLIALLGAVSLQAADANPDFTPWEEIKISGGVKGTAGRLRYFQTESFDESVQMPYMSYIPEKHRILMMFNCNLTPNKTVVKSQVHYPRLIESDDEGETWGSPRLPLPQREDGLIPIAFGYGMRYHGNGFVSMYSSEDNGVFNWLTSHDYGMTWTVKKEEVTKEFGQIYGWEHDLLVPTEKGSRLFATGYYQGKDGMEHALLRWSDNLGKSWTPWKAVPQWAFGSEVDISLTPQGELIAAQRSDREKWDIDHRSSLEYSISKDLGKTWSERKEIQPSGRHHPSTVTLPDGRMVMSYVVRIGYPSTPEGNPQFGIEAVVSYDGGHTWDTEHKYQLVKTVGSTYITLDSGEKYPLAAWAFAVQGTSTIYLPEKGKLLTAFGSTHKATCAHGGVAPRVIGFVEWMPEEIKK